jgi:hypothetical protein
MIESRIAAPDSHLGRGPQTLALRRRVSKGDGWEAPSRRRRRATPQGETPLGTDGIEDAAALIADRREDKHGGERRFRGADRLSVGQEALLSTGMVVFRWFLLPRR